MALHLQLKESAGGASYAHANDNGAAMKWLFNRNPKPGAKDIAEWLGGIKPSQKVHFHELHKNTRRALFETIAQYMLPLIQNMMER